MRARNFYSVALVATFVRGDVILDASMVCSKPAQRREWRTLTIEEQVAFIDAVKVCFPLHYVQFGVNARQFNSA